MTTAKTNSTYLRFATPHDVPVIAQLIRELAQYERLEHLVVADEAGLRAHLFGSPQRAEVLLACVRGAAHGQLSVAGSVVGHGADDLAGADDAYDAHGAESDDEDADAGEQVAGFALFFHNFSTFLGRPGLYLEDLFVRPAYRGLGLGLSLMLALARLAQQRGCGRFEWSVLDWNQPSLDFYRALGAVGMDEWRLQRVSGAALQRLAQTPMRHAFKAP